MNSLKSVLFGGAAVGLAFAMSIAPASAQTSNQRPPAAGSQLQGGAQGGAEVRPDGGAGAQMQDQMQEQGQGGSAAQRQRGEQDSDPSSQRRQSVTGSGQDEEQQRRSGTSAQGQQENREPSGQAEGKTEGETSSQSQAKVELDQEQKTEIKQYFVENKTVIRSAPRVERTALSVSIGVTVPEHVHLVALPSAIVVDVPSDCPLMYFIWGNDVVIVDRCTRVVAEIIVNIV